MSPTELADLVALSLVPGLGPRLTQALLDRFGTAAAVRRARVDELLEVPQIGNKLARAFSDALAAADPQAEIDRALAAGAQLIHRDMPEFPPALREVDDAPHLLYVKGTLTPADANAISIVGSRRCSSYGSRMAHRIASGLARAGFTVVSGLALGIDAAAHLGALEAGGRTIAVMAGGLSAIYPPEHLGLSEQVMASGALVTETSMQMSPQRGMFHARNRIISALGRAVVVIEANDRSGALITARHALEQGRELFALPANVDSNYSAGSLQLLREGAKMIRGIDDLLEDIGALTTPVRPAVETKPLQTQSTPSAPPANLEPTQQKLWDLLVEPRHIDEIIRTMGLPQGELSALMLKMEMKRQIRRAPGNVYERR